MVREELSTELHIDHHDTIISMQRKRKKTLKKSSSDWPQ